MSRYLSDYVPLLMLEEKFFDTKVEVLFTQKYI